MRPLQPVLNAMPTPVIRTFQLGDYQTNCFVVTDGPPAAGADCWIVDCGFEPEPMFEAIDEAGLRPRAIFLTHAHPDHMAGVDAARARYGPIPLALHEAERGYCSDPMLNLSALLGVPVRCDEPDTWLSDGNVIEMAGAKWRVVHAPGHSPGCVLFVHAPSHQALVGDTLFAGSIGRIDFPTSDPAAMRTTIHETMMALPDELAIHPGHGPATTIGRERATNPFVTGVAAF